MSDPCEPIIPRREAGGGSGGAFTYQKCLPNVSVKHIGRRRASGFSAPKWRNNSSSLFKKDSVRIQISLSRAWNLSWDSLTSTWRNSRSRWEKMYILLWARPSIPDLAFSICCFSFLSKQIFPPRQLSPEGNMFLVQTNQLFSVNSWDLSIMTHFLLGWVQCF